jgi:SAM-dependent methyltransferase
MTTTDYDKDSLFEGYTRFRDDPSCINEVLEQAAVKALLPPLAGLRVLDMGCGPGNFCHYAAKQGARRVVGIDVSERLLGYAREHHAHAAIEYRALSIEDAAFDDASFDVVVSSYCLHYLADLGAVFRKVSRWLAPRGVLVYSGNHPMLSANKAQQGTWAEDENGKAYWLLGDYHEEGARPRTMFQTDVVRYHRKLSTHVNLLVDSGFRVSRVVEPEPPPSDDPLVEAERVRPSVLIVRAEVAR